jgi:hypothetical protein
MGELFGIDNKLRTKNGIFIFFSSRIDPIHKSTIYKFGIAKSIKLNVDSFFSEDLSPLFEKNSSPNLAGFSFGIRLL